MYRAAIVCTWLLILAVALPAGFDAWFAGEYLPVSPVESGPLGALSGVLLVSGALALPRSLSIAGLLVGLAGLCYVIAATDVQRATLAVWTLLYLASVGLIRRAQTEREQAKRAAIHSRIDEELRPTEP